MALAFTKDSKKIQWIIENGLLKHQIKFQDVHMFMSALASNEAGRPKTWELISNNHLQNFSSSNSFKELISDVTMMFNTENSIYEVSKYLDGTNTTDTFKNNLIARIENNIHWIHKHSRNLNNYLFKHISDMRIKNT